jgi:multicomponent K+:H+ antiporter subunit G
MSLDEFPLWAQWLIASLTVLGALVALLGSWGLMHLKTYYERVHTPAIIATMGCWLIMWATLVFYSVSGHSPALHALLLAVFVAVTVPISTIFLMRAALFRDRRRGEPVPPSISSTVSNVRQAAPAEPETR